MPRTIRRRSQLEELTKVECMRAPSENRKSLYQRQREVGRDS